MHSKTRALIVFLGLIATSPVVLAGSRTICVEGPSAPVDPHFANQLRPDRTAVCPYDFDEVVTRITQISTDKRALDTVETAEKKFGIPEMTTSYDDPHTSDYTTILKGPDGWRMLVWVREWNREPERFLPGLHPKRLYTAEDVWLRIDLTVTGPSPTLGSVQCVPVNPLLDAFVKEGWKDITYQVSRPTDGARWTPLFEHGNKRVSILGERGGCAQYIALMQSPAK